MVVFRIGSFACETASNALELLENWIYGLFVLNTVSTSVCRRPGHDGIKLISYHYGGIRGVGTWGMQLSTLEKDPGFVITL